MCLRNINAKAWANVRIRVEMALQRIDSGIFAWRYARRIARYVTARTIVDVTTTLGAPGGFLLASPGVKGFRSETPALGASLSRRESLLEACAIFALAEFSETRHQRADRAAYLYQETR
ncbi:hypothetical protein PT2222_220051 [Paraburkholderia tropica]